jgi:hypothetical protein
LYLFDEHKPFKYIHVVKKKLIETKALASGHARKVASYYATFVGEEKTSVPEMEGVKW